MASCVSVLLHSASLPRLDRPFACVGASFLCTVDSYFIVWIRFTCLFVDRCFWVVSAFDVHVFVGTFRSFFSLKVYLIFIRERGKEGEKEGEKHGSEKHRSVASHTHLTP